MTESFLDCGVTFVLSCPPEALLKRTQKLEAAKSEELRVKGDQRVFCKQCGRDFFNQAKLRSHQKYGCISSKNEITVSLYDEKCKKELNSTSDEDINFPLAKAPVNEKHMFVCVVCTAEFMGIRNFIDHIKDHENNVGEWSDQSEGCNNEFKFDSFPNAFSKESDQEGQEKMHTYTPPKPHVCGICGKRFRFKVSLTRHIKCIHGNEKRFACVLCDKLFFEKSNLVKHLRVHTGDRPFSCKICRKQFRQASSMRLHYKIHTNEDRFLCDICDRSFPVESSLKKHLERHDVVLDFKCHTCLLTFPTNSTYKKHLLTHTGDRAFACNMCDKRFYHKGHLTEHIRVHTGEKPFECKLCQKRFTQRTALTQHNSRFHMNGKPFSCDLCGESFPRKCDVKVHRQTTRCV